MLTLPASRSVDPAAETVLEIDCLGALESFIRGSVSEGTTCLMPRPWPPDPRKGAASGLLFGFPEVFGLRI